MTLVASSPPCTPPSAGPMGYNGMYSGVLGVKLDDGTVVMLGARLFYSCFGDYSGGGSRWDVVELFPLEVGWVIRIQTIERGDAQPDGVANVVRWRSVDGGRTWKVVEEREALESGEPVDTFETPPPDARCVALPPSPAPT